jgi:6-pyruvoyl-tetrahydropterin synthase related domain
MILVYRLVEQYDLMRVADQPFTDQADDACVADCTSDPSWRVVLLLGAIVAPVTFLSLYTLGNLKDRTIGLVLHGQSLSISALTADLGARDAAAVLCAVAAIAAAVCLERRERTFSAFLVTMPRMPFAVVFWILLAWLAHAYFFSGVLLGGDTGTHIARFLEVRRGLEEGALPQWTNFQYLGSPLLGFTGPLTYVVGGAVDYFVHDSVVTAKLLLFGLNVLSGWLAYAVLRRFGLTCFGAALGALAFAGSFAHLHLFFYRGVFPQAFTICFFLAVFLTAEGLMRSEHMRWLDWAGFAFATGLLIVTHQPHAAFVAAYLALFGAISIATGRWRAVALPRLATAGMFGVAIATVAVLPILVESGWVMLLPEGGMFSFHVPTAQRLLNLVMWRNNRTTWGTDYWAYLGIVLVGLALAGVTAALRDRFATERGRLVLAVLPCLALSFFLANPVVRDIMFLLFFVAVLGGIGADAARTWLAAWPRAGLVIMLALLVDLSSTAIQPVARNDKQFLIDAGRYLETTAPNERVMEIGIDAAGLVTADIGPDAGPISYESMVQRIAGHHNMAATLVHNYAETAVKMAEADLRRDGTLSPQSAGLLALFNVGRIFCANSVSSGCPERFVPSVVEGPLGAVVRVPAATPVLYSRRLTAMPARPSLDKPMLWTEDFTAGDPRVAQLSAYLRLYLDEAQPDWTTREASSLPVLEIPQRQPDTVTSASWHARLEDYAVSLGKVTAVVTVDGPGYVQLSHPWFPSNVVRVNGVVVTPIESALHLVVVPLMAGSNSIEITPSVTSIRVLSAGVSAAAAAAILLIAAVGMLFRMGGRREPIQVRPADHLGCVATPTDV